MPLTFPTSPTNGQTATINGTTYTYTSVKNAWAPSAAGVDLSSVSQDILADADSSRSLGSPTNKWKNLHASNITSGDHLPLTDSSHDLGSPTNKWKALYLSSNTLFLGDSGSISAGAGGEITMPSMKIGSGANTVKIGVSASGEFETRKVTGGVVKAAKPSGTNAVQTFSGLASLVDNSAGDTVLVKDTKKVYMYDGTGWYLVATMVNDPPGAITDSSMSTSYSLNTDGNPLVIHANAIDPEGFPLTWSFTTSGLVDEATVVQGTGDSTNKVTITPSTVEANAGTFNLIANVTDGVNASVTKTAVMDLSFTIPNHDFIMAGSKEVRGNHGDGANVTFDFTSAATTRVQIDGSWAEYAATNTGINLGNIILGTSHGQAKTGDGFTYQWYYKTPSQFSEPSSYGTTLRSLFKTYSGVVTSSTTQLVWSAMKGSSGSSPQNVYQNYDWGNAVGSGGYAWYGNSPATGWLADAGTNSWVHLCVMAKGDKLGFFADGVRMNYWTGYDYFKTDLGYYILLNELPIGHYTDIHVQSSDVYGITSTSFTPPARRTY